MRYEFGNRQRVCHVLTIVLFLVYPLCGFPLEKDEPYKGFTGTVHQFGFVGGLYNTANPNYPAMYQTQSFLDYGMGTTYTMHDYITRQFTFDLITSVTLVTAESLERKGLSDHKQKMIWPIDCRFYLGPSEDFQAYIGIGLQWNMLDKTIGDYDLISGSAPSKTIHQLSGNTAIGLNFFGPQKYMIHLNMGAKLHYTITDNDNTTTNGSLIDLSKDRSCIILNGGITIDVDRKKNACLMLNYEYPLGMPKTSKGNSVFFYNTQTITMGVLFYIGGTR